MTNPNDDGSIPTSADESIRRGLHTECMTPKPPTQLDQPVDTPKQQHPKTKLLLFAAGTLVLLALSIFLLYAVLGPDGSGEMLLRTDDSKLTPNTVGVILPTLDTTYYKNLAQAFVDEADYYEWLVDVVPNSAAKNAQESLEQLLQQNVDAIIIDPDGLDEKAIQAFDNRCKDAGVPCVMLLNEGERYDCCSSSVWFDFQYLGTEMAHASETGPAYAIGSNPDSLTTGWLEEGLLRDAHYGIARDGASDLCGIAYVDENRTAKQAVTDALNTFPQIRTMFILDPDIVPDALRALDQVGYTGAAYCYAYESDVSDPQTTPKDESIWYSYYHFSETAYFCVMAVADQLEYGREPSYYTVNPYIR